MTESVIAGLVAGGAYAILGVCVVTLFRTTGVLNFGQGAIGTLGAYITFVLADRDWPLVIATLAGLVVAALVGLAVGWTMTRWFSETNVAVRSAVTIAVLVFVLALGFRLFGTDPLVTPDLVPRHSFDVFGVVVTLGSVVAIVLALVAAAVVTLVLNRTRLGLHLRAMSERAVTAELLGVNAAALSAAVWAGTGAFSCLAILLVAPNLSPTFLTLSLLVVPAMAAGIVGGLSSLGLTVGGGLVIGALEGAGSSIASVSDYRDAAPLLVIVITLLWARRKEAWDAAR